MSNPNFFYPGEKAEYDADPGFYDDPAPDQPTRREEIPIQSSGIRLSLFDRQCLDNWRDSDPERYQRMSQAWGVK